MINWEQQFADEFIGKQLLARKPLAPNEWVLIETEPYRLKHPFKANYVCPNATYKAVKLSDLKKGDKVVIDCMGRLWDFHSQDSANKWNFDRPRAWSWITIK